MDLILQLKLKFPGNFFYIRGNHDSFDPELNKQGIPQGALFKETLLKRRGQAYVEEMEDFYDNLPHIICSDSFIACHAGPPRRSVSRDDLINIIDDKKLAAELSNNRLQLPNHPGGHTPMDPFGSFWLHAGTIKNHHIIYSAHMEGPSVIIQVGNRFMPISFPAEPLSDLCNALK
jgi:hypothetical protein